MAERLDENEAREILEQLARTGPPSAQVAAIRVLLKLDKEEAEQDTKTRFDELYEFN